MADTLIELIGRLATYQTETDTGETVTRYRTLLAPEGLMAGIDDRRIIEPGGLSWIDQPVKIMWDDSEMGHVDAVHVGVFTGLHKEEVDGTVWVVADDIEWDLHEDNKSAARAKRLVDEGQFNGVSIHMRDMDYDFECPDDEDAPCDTVVYSAKIALATIVAIPAFEDAEIQPVAAAAASEVDLYRPPRDWFDNPQLDEPTFLTVTDEGRVYGHLFTPDSCHLGFPFTCETPPQGDVDYDEFNGHARVVTADGANIPAGVLTFNTGHAGLDQSPDETIQHYDTSGTVAAYVRVGEDEHGAWLAGAVAPGLTREDRETITRLSVSGDWRPRNGRYMLAAALVVPVPGYGIRAKVASGKVVGMLTGSPAKPEFLQPDLVLVADALGAVRTEIAEFRKEMAPIIAEKRRAELIAALAVFEETVA